MNQPEYYLLGARNAAARWVEYGAVVWSRPSRRSPYSQCNAIRWVILPLTCGLTLITPLDTSVSIKLFLEHAHLLETRGMCL